MAGWYKFMNDIKQTLATMIGSYADRNFNPNWDIEAFKKGRVLGPKIEDELFVITNVLRQKGKPLDYGF